MKPRAARARPDLRKSLVGFLIGSTRYAVSVGCVRQVINPGATTPVPQAPPYLAGLAEFRGEVIPIVDFRVLLGAPAESSRRTKWMIIDLDGRAVGLVVDAVSAVFGTPDELKPAPVAVSGEAGRSIVGVTTHESAMVYVIEPGRLGIPLSPVLDRVSLPAPGAPR